MYNKILKRAAVPAIGMMFMYHATNAEIIALTAWPYGMILKNLDQ